MNVFLCYASEDHDVAERVQLALAGAGFAVFFDEQSLPPGSDFQARIQEAIAQSDLFVFLITASSVARGRFTLTELQLAREKWPHPGGRVLPVNVDGTPVHMIPNYLRAATILEVKGNAPAEVRAVVEKLRAGRTPRLLARLASLGRRRLLAGLLVMAVIVLGVVVEGRWGVFGSKPPGNDPARKVDPPPEAGFFRVIPAHDLGSLRGIDGQFVGRTAFRVTAHNGTDQRIIALTIALSWFSTKSAERPTGRVEVVLKLQPPSKGQPGATSTYTASIPSEVPGDIDNYSWTYVSAVGIDARAEDQPGVDRQ
jgi:TIR domain